MFTASDSRLNMLAYDYSRRYDDSADYHSAAQRSINRMSRVQVILMHYTFFSAFRRDVSLLTCGVSTAAFVPLACSVGRHDHHTDHNWVVNHECTGLSCDVDIGTDCPWQSWLKVKHLSLLQITWTVML